MLETNVSGRVEEDVDADALGRREQDFLDEFLALMAAAVAADELHLRPAHPDVEDPGVGGVNEVQAHDLAPAGSLGELGLAVDQHHVPNRPIAVKVGPELAKGTHPPVLDQDVVEGDCQLAIDRRPVVLIARPD